MKLSSVLSLTTVAALVSASNGALFGALNLRSIRARISAIRKLAKVIRNGPEVLIWDDVHLPESITFKKRIQNFAEFQKKANKDVFLYSFLPKLLPEADIPPILDSLDTSPIPLLDEIAGQAKPGKEAVPRNESWRKVYSKVINRCIKVNIDDPDPVEGYLYFGNQDFKKILSMYCQVNPFFASALTVSSDNQYLELNACDPGSDSDAKYLNVMRTMTNDDHRINVRFNMDMSINQMVDYSSGSGVLVPEDEWDYYASGVLYNLLYYASNIHATIHVLHYIMCAGIKYSTRHDKSLSAWAEPYDDNIALKYTEVALLLFKSNLPVPESSCLLTGKDGFGGSVAVKDVMRDILGIWGSCKNAKDFIKTFLLKDLYATAKNPEKVIKDANILTEFMKHADNVKPFADDLAKAMKKDNKEAFQKAEDELTKFMSDCGEGVSSIDSISSWVQLMSMTGIMHGSTISYTRTFAVPEILRWRVIDAPKFDKIDVGISGSGLGTVQGMTVDRHVFTHEIKYGKIWNTSPISDRVKKVLATYDSMAEDLKIKYAGSISKRDDFREFGWILSDFCVDGYDGKQATITTYI